MTRTTLWASCLGVLILSVASSPVTAAPRPPSGLTAHGRIVWQFDALLHDTFGNKKVCVGPRSTIDFQLQCAPEWNYVQYLPTFASRGSSWRLTTATPGSTALGTFAFVQVGGRYVKCSSTTWLVSLGGTANFTPFGCRPLPR